LKAVFVLIVVVVLFFVGKLGQSLLTPPGCQSAPAVTGLIAALKDTDFGSFAVNDVTTHSSGLLSHERVCTGEVASLRGGLSAQNMHWYSVRYTVKSGSDPDQAVVAAKMGDQVPLAPNKPVWVKLTEYLLY
jgi:hypothetical protein